ncbi:cytochrome c-type biogenesis protein [Enhygromyxa salina]|uniref:Cytochrome c-type biogenesis protein n=1 Tax=Enhygromyxa salina TaxID=215803 RepID=A0A2S9YMP1_9BACT|nr:cytochrome c-type biogenesis protein CcmH [Enhygromyxa salina]PRQ06360.1 Cytochrome C biogenesis protein [Enhygromyxa salina]
MSSPVTPTPADLQAESLARDIAAEMPSPYCPGRSIASCPTQAARELEDDILGLAKQGQDREQIETALVSRFGEEKMGAAQQSEILVAIILGAVLALAMIVVFARKWLRPAAAQAASGEGAKSSAPLAKVSADELDRLEDELDEIDGI